ncbi:hypothetical protein [Paenibacillus stellifer]|uniref:hypothetical protein n=1 Tax=Paenibacillus stellifer TaxID=169760 RepID=UPI0012EEC90F|nr:hypothetical protein [Paenibacillus stellifer]
MNGVFIASQPLIIIEKDNKVQSPLLETIKSVWAIEFIPPHPTQSIAPNQALHEDFLANEQFGIANGKTPYHIQMEEV